MKKKKLKVIKEEIDAEQQTVCCVVQNKCAGVKFLKEILKNKKERKKNAIK